MLLSPFYPPSAFSHPRFILHPHFLIRVLSSIRIFSSAFYPPSAFSHPRFIPHPHFLIRIFSTAIRIRHPYPHPYPHLYPRFIPTPTRRPKPKRTLFARVNQPIKSREKCSKNCFGQCTCYILACMRQNHKQRSVAPQA